MPVLCQRYRIGEIPLGLETRWYDCASHRDTLDSFRTGYLWDEFSGCEPELATRVASQDACIVMRGEFPDTSTLDYLRDTIGLVTHFLDHGGVAVYDPQMFRWWTPGSWHEQIFAPAEAVPHHHTVILVSSEEEDTEWIHKRGMRKFGRPDLSFRGVTRELRSGAIEVCNRFIEFQAFGGSIAEGSEIEIPALPRGLRCFHRGNLDDPDFNNVHVAIERIAVRDG